MSFKAVLAVALLAAVATAMPSSPYKPPPTGYKPEAKPYEFAYGVQDPYQGLDFGQSEASDGNAVEGTYSVQLPDGRKQTVKYLADHHQGFHADVSYHGEAQYPPKSGYPPFTVKPSGYHSEPVYKPEPPVYKPQPVHKPPPSYH